MNCMDISIVNITPKDSNDPMNEYIIRHQRVPLATFLHADHEGLHTYLQRAADAIQGIDVPGKLEEHRLLMGGYRH